MDEVYPWKSPLYRVGREITAGTFNVYDHEDGHRFHGGIHRNAEVAKSMAIRGHRKLVYRINVKPKTPA